MNIQLLLSTVVMLLGAAAASPPPDPASMRYDLRAGDHLVYRQTFEQDIDGRRSYGYPVPAEGPATGREIGFRAEWESHVLVSTSRGGGATVGFARRLRSVDVDRYRLGGVDRLTAATADSLLRRAGVRRDGPFAHASRFDPRGRSQLPATVVREWPASKVLWGVLEVLPLPPGEVEPGDTWQGRRGLQLRYRAEAWEELTDAVTRERCLRVEGRAGAVSLLSRPASLADSVRLRYWFCPGTGTLARVELTASYPSALYERVDERAVLERVARSRGEAETGWLSAGHTRDGALAARLVRADSGAWSPALDSLIRDPDPGVRRRALALAWRSGHRVDGDALPSVVGADSTERRLLRRLAGDRSVRRREAAPGAGARDPEPGRGRESPDCEDPAGLLSRLREAKARGGSPEKPGTTLRAMRTRGHVGWPYVLHVPIEYRGDEPFPLIVYLGGNRGSAVEGALLGEAGLAGREFLVAYPHADALWWEESATSVVDALLREIMVLYNVDADRIYISGLSNGGTGAYYYAARWPHRFTAAVASMGAGQYAPYLSAGRLPPSPSNLAHLPLLFLHGGRDATIPDSMSRKTGSLVAETRRTAPVEIHVFPERGHGIVPGRGDDGRTLDFFRRFRRRPSPAWLDARLRQPAGGRHYWVDVTPTAASATAEVEGELRSRGEVRIRTSGVRQIRLLLAPERLPPDRRVTVRWNGDVVYRGVVRPDCRLLARSFSEEGDPHLAYAAEVRVSSPPDRPPGPGADAVRPETGTTRDAYERTRDTATAPDRHARSARDPSSVPGRAGAVSRGGRS